ncbi:molecular chaperone DnaJ [Candidatus Phytoplasma melaleucae]|uniref:molecular chaperone DnaJ n=1 Tax=Candidatus Phytoplasma melaleucae TaxID=2982630 RepID=UPI002715184F|nr:molecular chaperone DnaJ ['Melaleuca sp.' phytoplasma]MDV3205182.1 molecular chaperone DnaJ [Weeping tea tree witches'-broom phytoplasma]
MKKDYYNILGLSRNANEDDIKKAYRRLAKKYHPDVSKEPNADEKFKEIQEAYRVLSDPGKKAQYDNPGHSFSGFNENFSGFQDFNNSSFDFDIFSSFFGSKTSNRNKTGSGEDKHIKIIIDFMEAALGTEKKIKFDIQEDCSYCGGTGAKSKEDIKICSYCNGLGYVAISQRFFLGDISTQQVCPQCRGKKRIIINQCSFCQGKKRIKNTKQITLKIPAGVENGMTLKSSQQGHSGYQGSVNGDLYVEIHIKPHTVFKREGNDVISAVFINFYQAALGTIVNVNTIHGEVELKIPGGTQTDTKFRLKNKGIPYLNSSSRLGDHYVVVKVRTPDTLSQEQKSAFKKLEELDQLEKKQKKNRSWFF